jgi:F-type H+-transporting ATPase subunit a
MEHHSSWLTVLLNKLIGKPVAALLAAVGVHVHDPANPIPEQVVMSAVVFVLLIGFSLWLRARLSVERPGAAQQIAEGLLTNKLGVGIRDLLDNNVGHHGREHLAFVGTISLFILVSNSISLIPAFTSPTIHPSVPLACAILTFAYYNWQGIRHVGALGYAKHFAGPVWWLSWLMFPVEIISHSARILSLTVRLYANIFSSELLYSTILGLFLVPTLAVAEKNIVLGGAVGIFAATLPLAFLLLHAFVAVMQAFVFTILPCIYLSLATAEEH